MAPQPPERMVLRKWSPLRKGALIGFANITLPPPLALEIDDVAILQINGKTWVSLPARPIIGQDGRVGKLPGSGKTHYVSSLRWGDRRLATAFSQRVVELVRAADPGAFDPEAPP
jgi:hypothetical protein